MNLVLDASIVVKWFVDEPLHQEARALIGTKHSLHAPELLVAEVANAAWKIAARQLIDPLQAQQIVAGCTAGIPRLHLLAPFAERAMELALALNHPAYDCFYLACAEHLQALLVTADQRLLGVAQKNGLHGLVVELSAFVHAGA